MNEERLLIGKWYVRTTPMHLACSHVASHGSLLCYSYQTHNLKENFIPHRERRTIFLRKKNMKNVLINTKTINAANYIETFNIPTVLTAMFTGSCNICWFALHEAYIDFDVNSNVCLNWNGLDLSNLNKKKIKLFRIIVMPWILHSLYRII